MTKIAKTRIWDKNVIPDLMSEIPETSGEEYARANCAYNLSVLDSKGSPVANFGKIKEMVINFDRNFKEDALFKRFKVELEIDAEMVERWFAEEIVCLNDRIGVSLEHAQNGQVLYVWSASVIAYEIFFGPKENPRVTILGQLCEKEET